MAVVMSIPSQVYTPRRIEQQRSIPAAVKRMRFTLTREAWPAGPIGSIGLTYPNGEAGPSITFNGGSLWTDATGKRVSETMVPGVTDILLLTSFFEFSWTNPQTGVQDLPAGTYTFWAEILQTITTSFTVERF